MTDNTAVDQPIKYFTTSRSSKFIIFLLLLLLLAAIIFSYSLITQNKQLKSNLSGFEKNDKLDTTFETTTGETVGGLLQLDENLYVHFRGKEIAILSSNDSGYWLLTNKQYPKLFEQTDRAMYAYTAELMNDEVHKKQFLIIYLNIFEGDSYRPIYGVILDQKEQKQVYEMPDLKGNKPTMLENDSIIRLDLAGPYFWNSCINCQLRLLEFVGYRPEIGKFVPVNERFISEFIELLNEYDNIAEEKCKWQGKVKPVSEIQKTAGEDVKCDDDLGGNGEHFITIKEFNYLRDNIQRIIDGTINSLVEKTNKEQPLNVIGVIRTSGLLEDEQEALGLNSSNFQITSPSDIFSDKLGIRGYYLESNEMLDNYLGKCVSVEGNVKNGWENIKEEKDFTINEKYTYGRGALALENIKTIEDVNCFTADNIAVKLTPSENSISIQGVLQHAARPAPDISYDYVLTLSVPYFDELNAQGIPSLKKIDVVPAFDLPIPILESFVSKEVTLLGEIEWGYSESRVFRAVQIY